MNMRIRFPALRQKFFLFLLVFLMLASSACAPTPAKLNSQLEPAPGTILLSENSTPTTPAATSTPTRVPTKAALLVNIAKNTASPSETSTVKEAETPTATLTPTRTPMALENWQDLPILPYVSDNAVTIYQRGLDRGRNPQAFSKVGDCQNITTYFLANFDEPGRFDLGSQTNLQATIDWFAGSFERESLAVKGGFNAAAMLSPLRADPKECKKGENPLSCELRANNPSIALISLEEWWAGKPENYEKYMRQIIEYTLSQDVLPVLATKADNLEGEHTINKTLAHLAWEYDIPIWNFWRAVQPLASHGLVDDGFHLTYGNIYAFQLPLSEWTGWTVRNLTALQVLETLRVALINE